MELTIFFFLYYYNGKSLKEQAKYKKPKGPTKPKSKKAEKPKEAQTKP